MSKLAFAKIGVLRLALHYLLGHPDGTRASCLYNFAPVTKEPFDMIFFDPVELCMVDFPTVEDDNPGVSSAYGLMGENEIFHKTRYTAGPATFERSMYPGNQ